MSEGTRILRQRLKLPETDSEKLIMQRAPGSFPLWKSPSEDSRLERPLPVQGRRLRKTAVRVRPPSAQDSR